jgi:hypothetical protein
LLCQKLLKVLLNAELPLFAGEEIMYQKSPDFRIRLW